MTETVFAPRSVIEAAPATRRGFDALSGLTVYLVLLCAIPSNLVITPLGSLGRPAQLWGLFLALWWTVHQLQAAPRPVPSPWQPLRLAFGAFVVVALISYAAAVLRGQPADQISPATTALVKLVSWGGVMFVAMDGIRTMRDLRALLHRLVVAVTVVALLGLVQTFTGRSWIDQLSLPGFSPSEEGGVQSRGALTRAAGTATHPLEYAMLLGVTVPIALTLAALHTARGRVTAWTCAAVISVATLVSASRTALLGFAAALLAVLPGLDRRVRHRLVAGIAVLAVGAVLARPGLVRTMLAMFTGVATDPSALSRTNGLERVPGFIAVSPIVGSGFGTFLPRYYIFDDQWVLTTVDSGFLGLIAFAGLVIGGAWSALRARRISDQADVRVIGQGLFAACTTAAVMLAGFDGLSFPISAGVLFLVLGAAGSLRAIAGADHWMTTVRASIVDADRPPRGTHRLPGAVPAGQRAATR
ncbi:O-antigen ligase family protein [Microbacterium luticocti]|uniref:O-antigen ligase family protein n=1 Tax=Microbacterium luticocti TaxID=451764 RepID=UPI0004295488|nr:hypothetical protein [Microbacterium luticocti]